MSESTEGKFDEMKGRVKEAAGSLTGDEKLKNEGRADQLAGQVKEKAGALIDKVRQKLTGEEPDEKSDS